MSQLECHMEWFKFFETTGTLLKLQHYQRTMTLTTTQASLGHIQTEINYSRNCHNAYDNNA